MALLERENFLAELHSLLLQAKAGSGSLLFLGGEAGIGKSELLRAFSQDAAASVLLGACDSLSTPRPLGPLLDMAVDGDIGLDRHDIASMTRDEVFGAFLKHLVEPKNPRIVVFEDVHWADEATLDLLRFLGRRLNAAQVLMIVSYRDDEVGPTHPLRIVMGDLATSPTYRRMKLTCLSLYAVRELAADSEIDPEELYRRTGGNPFYVTEVLASGESGVPTRISDAVLARAARLSRDSRAVLDACSVLGFRFDPYVVATVMGAETDTPAAFEECVAAGMLVTNERTMAFRHELARDALLEVVAFTRKQALHKRTLEALVANGSTDLSSLAHHAEGAIDREAVLDFAPAAAQAALNVRAHREAAAQFGRALRFADGLPPAEHAALLESYAFESTWIDHPVQAEEAYRQAIQLRTEIGDSGANVVNLVRLAQNLRQHGRHPESREQVETALKLIEDVPPGIEHAILRAFRACVLMLDHYNHDAIVEGERAKELAREFNDENSLMLAYNFVGSSRIQLADYQDGEQQLLYSLRLARRYGNDSLAALAYTNLGSGFGEMYKFEKAEAYLREGRAFCRERDVDFSRNYIESWLALTRMFIGAWDEAAELAADQLRRPGGSVNTRIMALVALGRVRARRGDPDVWTVLDEALDLAVNTATLQRVGPVQAARAEAAFLAGDAEKAASEAAAAFALAVEHRHPWLGGELSYWLRMANLSALADHEFVEADLDADPDSGSGSGTEAAQFMAEPYALELAGDWAGAARAWEELGCPYEMARALTASDDAEPLERARATFERLGAGPSLALVEAKMRAMGHRVPRGPAPSTVTNPANLTRREAQVIKLLAQGMTNQEIADKLFRSVRTIDHHVSAILAKLEAGNRVEAAQTATQLGLLD